MVLFRDLDQIQLEVSRAVDFNRCTALLKDCPTIPIFVRNETTELPMYPRHPTSIGSTWHVQPFSMQSDRRSSYWALLCSCAISIFPSHGTVNSMTSTHFLASDQTTMSGRWFVRTMCTGKFRRALISARIFQSRAPASSFEIRGLFFRRPGRSPSLIKWTSVFLEIEVSRLVVSHCVSMRSLITSSILLCRHVYICSDFGHADST